MRQERLSTNMTPMTETTITLRPAAAADIDALELLAGLGSGLAPRGDVHVAEVGGTIWAAISADDGHAVADPFRPSGDLMQLLRQRVGSAPRDRLLPARREAHGL